MNLLALLLALLLGILSPANPALPHGSETEESLLQFFGGGSAAEEAAMAHSFTGLLSLQPAHRGMVDPLKVIQYFNTRYPQLMDMGYYQDAAFARPALAEEYNLDVKVPVSQYITLLSDLPADALMLTDLYNFDEDNLRWSLYLLSDLDAAYRLLICRETPGSVTLLVIDIPAPKLP